MSESKMQYCDFCGEVLGVFAWSRHFQGPLSCESSECQREEREQERQAQDDARSRAEKDDYSAYRGEW